MNYAIYGFRYNACDYRVCDLLFDDYAITGYVVCCAKCQFLPFLPFPSITMPPYWKMLLS